MIQFHCAKCGKRLMVKDESAGKRAKCPGCGEVMLVPGAKSAAPAGPAARPAAPPPKAPAPRPQPAAPPPPPRPPAQVPKAAATVSLGTGPAGGVVRAPSRLSKKFYLISMIAGPASFAVVGILYIVGLFVFGGGAIVAQQGGAENPQEAAAHMAAMGQGMMGVGLLCLILFIIAYAVEIYSGVIGFVLLYRMWSALQAGPVRATPGKRPALHPVLQLVLDVPGDSRMDAGL